MTKSDKKRVLAALKRWEARFTEVDNDRNATPSDLLMAAVNWLRAMAKLANEYIDDGGKAAEDWADEHLVSAGLLVLSECRKLEEDIKHEAKNL